MASPVLHILVTAASLMVHMAVMAQRDVVISVSYGGSSTYLYHIGFNISLFTEFHECLSKGTLNCVADYGTQHCPNCTVETVKQSGQINQEENNYYKCTNNGGPGTLNCKRQTEVSTTTGIQPETYLLKETSYPSICFGFVWTFDTEGISFNSGQWGEEFCGDNCACPNRSTTPQLLTSTQSLLPSLTVSLPSISATFSSSYSSSPSATTQKPSLTETPTKLITAVSTANPGSPLTESSSGTANSGDDLPIGVIAGAAAGGIIAIIVIIIVIVVVCRRRRAKAKSSDYADHETSVTSSNGAGVSGKTNDGTSNSYYNSEFSDKLGELQTANTGANNISGYHNTLHQPIIKNGEAPVKHPPKPQFTIKDNDSDFGYSTAQLVIPEDNNNTKGKKSHDNYDYVSVEDDTGVTELKPETTRGETPVVKPPKVKDDYAVVDKARKTDLNQDFDYDCSRASDGYSTAGNVNQPNPNKDDPDATGVYSKLHQEVRDIQNPYNVGPNTNDVYSKLHEEEVRDIKNPYNVLPEQQGASDTNSALQDTAHNARDTKEAKPSKSLPYGKEDYAVVVKTKSTNKPTQASFQLRNDEN